MNQNRIQIIGLCIAVFVIGVFFSIASRAFLSPGNLFDMLRFFPVDGLIGLAMLLALIAGGVDVSFPAIANASVFIAGKVFLESPQPHPADVVLFLAAAVAIGIAFGMLNGVLIAWLKAPALIISLGTTSLYLGASLFFFGGTSIYDLPEALRALSRLSFISVPDPQGTGQSSMHWTFLLFALAAVLVACCLRFTRFGRQLYAVGGSSSLASRAGVSVPLTMIKLYAVAGLLAALAGLSMMFLYGNIGPVSLQGHELFILGAIVLGGASLFGGRGSVGGTVLGLLLVFMVQNSLTLIGVPATWQNVAVGALLLVGMLTSNSRLSTELRWRRRGRAAPSLAGALSVERGTR